MGIFKWIGAGIGWSFGGPIGAILGLALGSIGDSLSSDDKEFYNSERKRQTGGSSRYSEDTTQPGDFEVSLLILASVVIKADGVQDKREFDLVREYFLKLYGKERANNAFRLFKQISSQKISVRQVCMQIQQTMAHASRLQLIHFLFDVALADGHLHVKEELVIRQMANYLRISAHDYESIKAMFFKDEGQYYKILELDESATAAEIKKAYRKMAKKYHPDKLQHLGESHRKGAEEKFRKVQEAYEALKKEKGFV